MLTYHKVGNLGTVDSDASVAWFLRGVWVDFLFYFMVIANLIANLGGLTEFVCI